MPRLDEATAVRYNRDGPLENRFRGLGIGAGAGAGGIIDTYFAEESLYSQESYDDVPFETVEGVWPNYAGIGLSHQIAQATDGFNDMPTSIENRYLRIRTSNDHASLIPPGAENLKNVEVLARMAVTSTTHNSLALRVRGTGDPGNPGGYGLLYHSTNLRLVSWGNGENNTSLVSDLSADSVGSKVWVWGKLRIIDDLISAKAWLGNLEEEPATWEAEDIVNNDWPDAGSVSFGTSIPPSGSVSHFLDYIKVSPL